MNAKLRGLVQDPADLLEEPDCPGLSPHLRTAVPKPEKLLWVSQPRGPYRVVDYTCDCEAVFYELVSCGGMYQIHKVVQAEPPSTPTQVPGRSRRPGSGGCASSSGKSVEHLRVTMLDICVTGPVLEVLCEVQCEV
ncbi:hypothetical protein GCM10027612_01750 [Microbispora bryophytorum subsp. camponoti]